MEELSAADAVSETPDWDEDPPPKALMMMSASPRVELANVGIGEEITTRSATEEARDKISPEMVIAGPPGAKVCVPMIKADSASAVTIDPSMVMIGTTGDLGTWDIAMVEDPTTKAVPDSASERTVPETVSAGPPGTSVWPLMI